MLHATALNIAITDKNPHVREFLCRELAGLGFEANAIAGATPLLEALCSPRPPRVLVLDPEALGARLGEVARRLKACGGVTTVVLHLFDGAEPGAEFDGALVVEKRPDMAGLTAALTALAAQLARLAGRGAQEEA